MKLNIPAAMLLLVLGAVAVAQEPDQESPERATQQRNRTTRPVIRGKEYAVVSMKPQSTQVAERILREIGRAHV